MVRVYAAATGRSLFRDTPDVDPEERRQIERYLSNGIRLSIDPKDERIAGLVTVVRRTEEPLIFVVETDSDRPLREFIRTVQETCTEQETWDLVTTRIEFTALQTITTEDVEIDDETVEEITGNLKESRSTISTHDDYESAVATVVKVLQQISNESICPGEILLTTDSDPSIDTTINHVGVVCEKSDSETSHQRTQNRLVSTISKLFGFVSQ